MSRYLFQRSLLISFGFFLIYSSNAQEILWEKSYGGTHSEYLFDAIPTADYGFILAGSSLSGKSGNKAMASAGNFDYWIWKMDEKGDLDWQHSFGGSGTDHLNSIRSTSDGGYILAGTSNSPKDGDKKEESYGQEDFWIIKLNAGYGATTYSRLF
ncbi:MAG: hypothetical protein GX163_05830 [Bacteroidetes bacterium]|jgi:hypothetical protein|nr:hypothetical protein [Bacteroidota bacterium]